MRKLRVILVCLLFATSVIVAAGCAKKEEAAKPAEEAAKPAEQAAPAAPASPAEQAPPASPAK